jgi:predicted alpha/beta-hydrolase family hydrolase
MAPVPMTPDDYLAAIEVLELAGEALHAKGNPEQRHVEALMCLRATVESCKPIDAKGPP